MADLRYFRYPETGRIAGLNSYISPHSKTMKNLLDQVDLEHGKFACFRGKQEIIGPKSFKTSEECHPPDIKHPSIPWSQICHFPIEPWLLGGV